MAQLVEALHYRSEGRGVDSRMCHNPSGRIMALGSTQPLTEMSTWGISWGVKQPVRRADNLTTFLKSGSLNLLESSGPVHGSLYY